MRFNKNTKFLLAFVIFVAISLVIRVFNIEDALFFTWDQGRDFFAVEKIVQGHITLVGPTTGLPGFFLGPLWYYLGVPGYILGKGNPFVFSLWYIALNLIATLPLFWLLGKTLFKKSGFAIATAYTLSLIPGSIWGTIRVWNPLISIPLMIGAYLSLVKARHSRIWLAIGFFLLGLTLQSEFAYAAAIIAVLFVLITWIRGKFSITDYIIAALALGVTLLPQLIFELRHDFIMSQSLLGSLFGNNEVITWAFHLSRRPLHLLQTTRNLFIGKAPEMILPLAIIATGFLVGSFKIVKLFKKENEEIFAWKLLFIIATVPYIFFLLWKGNHGYFFEYYLTPHFVFLVPIVMLGAKTIYESSYLKKITSNWPSIWLVILGIVVGLWYQTIYKTVMFPINNAGYRVMNASIHQILNWVVIDQQNPGLIRIFTPNRETEHYDAILHWAARSRHLPIPHTVKSAEDKKWYILIEPDHQTTKRLDAWYKEATAGGILKRSQTIGDLKIESWSSIDSVP